MDTEEIEEQERNEIKDMVGGYGGWQETVHMMDDEIREEIHSRCAPCSKLEFLKEYMDAHQEKYNEKFVVS